MITRRDFMKAGAAMLTASQAAELAAQSAGQAHPNQKKSSSLERAAADAPWTARWIWPSLSGLEPNYFVYFRRTFNLHDVPAENVYVKISARTDYILYVNGHNLGFGPPIADARRYYFDLRDIQPFLRKGKNVIAARAYSLATNTEDTKKVPGGFLIQGKVGDVSLDSDRTWKFLVPEVWKQDAPRQSFQLHYVEIADFRKEPMGWNNLGFDDSGWKHPLEMSGPEGATEHLVLRDLGEIKEVFMPVAAAIRTAEVERKSDFAIPAVEINAEKFLPVETVRFQNVGLLAGSKATAIVQTTASGRDAAIVFDMGEMVLGCPYFEAEGAAGTVVDVSISEYLQDGRVLASRTITPVENTYLADRITLRQGKNAWQRNDYNGFRYLQLTVRNAAEPVTFRKVGTVLRDYQFQHEATFHSSNPMLDRIFEGSKQSHRVSCHWGYCGSAWREHAQWSDLPWPAANLMVFHDPPMLRYYLRQVALGQTPEGWMRFPYPGSIGGELPEQTMWIADDLWKCALYFDDRELVHDLLPVMLKANEWFLKHKTPRGLLTTKDWPKMWLVVDWGYPFVNDPVPGELATLNLIYYNFLRSVEKCANFDGNQEARENFGRQADALKETINKVFGVPEQGLYFEKPDRQFPSQFAATLAVTHGVAPEEHLQKIFDFAVGMELRPAKASPWFMWTTLEAFARAGRFEQAIQCICRYWSTFLNVDATTYWELWNIPGEDVHPLKGYTKEMGARTITYACAPAPYTARHILGVEPLEPGYRKTLVAPHTSGLDAFESKAPTSRGDVQVRYLRSPADNQTEFFVTVPATAVFRLPYSPEESFVTVNEQPLFSGGSFHSNSYITGPRAALNYLEMQLAPGSYYFRSSASEVKPEI